MYDITINMRSKQKITMLFETSKNSWHFINQGIIMLNYNDFRKALSLFNKALALEPENLVAQFHRGSTL